ncbi:MAG: CHAT domain-containing protein [Candidatus Fervidibacter sp.]|uniref:CHAT domain-containing protein n=1 Tax=Candidatus Fervidibacter sp. TaxID=3100871 RepID=UPI00404985D7
MTAFGLRISLLLITTTALSVITLAQHASETKGAKVFSAETEFFWAIDKEFAQGQVEKARQIIEANPEVARRLQANLLFVKLDLSLFEDAAPISPFMDEVTSHLNSVADERLKRLTNALTNLSSEVNPFQNEVGELANALSDFVNAARSNNLDDQIRFWQSAFQKCEKLGLELGKLICLHRIALAEREKGDFASSLSHSLQARELAEKWNYKARLASIINNLGVVGYRTGLLEIARRYLLSALEIAQEQKDERLQSIILTNLSAIAIKEGKFREAEEYLQKALEFGKTVARLTNLGVIRTYLRDYEAALLAFQEALQMAEKEQDVGRQISLWNNIGAIYWLQGNFDQAFYCLQRALEIAHKTEDLFRTAPVLLTLGLIYTDKGEFEQAEKCFTELLQISRQLGDRLRELEAMNRLGLLRVRQEQWDEAIRVMEETADSAEQIGHKPSKALALLTLGVAYEGKKEFEKALKAYEGALEIWQEANDNWGLAWTWKNIGEVYEKIGMELSREERERDLLQAIDAYWQAVRLMEKVRAGAGLETMLAQFAQIASEPFYRLINLLARTGRVEEAFEISERVRARALLELINDAALLERRAESEEVEETEYRELQKEVIELEDRLITEMRSPSPDWEVIERLQAELNSARSEFERQRDILRLRRWKLLPVQNQQIAYDAWRKLNLPGDTVVLVFSVLEQRTWLFVVTCEKGSWRIDCRELPITQKQLEEDITWLTQNLVKRRPVGATLSRLYYSLIAPVEKLLKGKRKLIIVPDGPLFGLPFQALQDGNGTYLVERFAISYSPSLTTLWAVNQNRKKVEPTKNSPARVVWTGLAVSDFGSALKSLPFAREEVNSIAKILTRSKKPLTVQIFVNSSATKPVAMKALRESQWVHFATHAVLELKHPLHSRLILKSNGERNGELHAFEVLDLGQVNSQMVVLSACETGLGKALKGEGILGLVWVFMATGVKALVVSQWQVDDLSTARLMETFYRYILKGFSLSEALCKAQTQLLSQRQFRHPYHWAGFVVWGKGF